MSPVNVILLRCLRRTCKQHSASNTFLLMADSRQLLAFQHAKPQPPFFSNTGAGAGSVGADTGNVPGGNIDAPTNSNSIDSSSIDDNNSRSSSSNRSGAGNNGDECSGAFGSGELCNIVLDIRIGPLVLHDR